MDELGYYSGQTFNCWKDLFSIADSEKWGNLFLNFTAIWTPTAHAHRDTKKQIQLKIIKDMYH
jgi:hypothetical protein